MYCGLSERDFWDMTIEEVNRFNNAYLKRYERQRKDAIIDIYNLADLCAHSIARLFNDNATYEPVDVYFPDMFAEEKEARLEQEAELSAQRFLLFAQSFNQRHED